MNEESCYYCGEDKKDEHGNFICICLDCMTSCSFECCCPNCGICLDANIDCMCVE